MPLISSRLLYCVLPFVLAAEPSAEDAADAATSMAGFCQNYPRPAYARMQRLSNPSDDWFELYAVADGVTAIYEPHQWQEAISYLIEGDDAALLFDTGNGIGDIRAVVDGLTEKPVTVLNSHGHFDHVGGNHAFDAILGLDTSFTRERQQGQPNEAIRVAQGDGMVEYRIDGEERFSFLMRDEPLPYRK